MAYSHKLHNPTPFQVNIDWERGIVISVAPDSSVDLSTRQMEQCMPGEPGSEEIKKLLDSHGVFLEDSDRDYDSQALACLKACFKLKKERYTEASARLSDLHTMQGIEADPNAPAFKQKLQSMGLLALQERMGMLERRIELYSKVVVEVDDLTARGHVFDPERTIFAGLDRPREFKSKTAMEVFLSEHPDVAEAHRVDLEGRVEVGLSEIDEPKAEEFVNPELTEEQSRRFGA